MSDSGSPRPRFCTFVFCHDRCRPSFPAFSWNIVCFLLNSTTRARPDFVVDFLRKTRLENPDLFLKMADDKEIVVGSLITIACSSGAASLLLKRKRKHSAWVKKYIRERGQYGERNTLLPELAATEVVKWLQYMRMDIEVFEELLSMVEPVIQRRSTKFS